MVENLESSFEYTDLLNAVKYFDKVVLITFKPLTKHNLPEGVDLHVIGFDNYQNFGRIRAILYLPQIVKEFFSGYGPHLTEFRSAISNFIRALFISREINRICDFYKHFEEKICYGFWFTMLSNASLLLNRNDLFRVQRVHGVDLYEERMPGVGRIPFRRFFLNKSDRILCVSEDGLSYLRKKYPKFRDKIWLSRLGTMEKGLNPFPDGEEFILLSCAHVRNIKRIYLVPNVLMEIPGKLRWIHIGDIDRKDKTTELLFNNLKKLSEKRNDVKVEMLEGMSQEDILNYYAKQPVHIFISLSETEGLPVSMMEAISFGIPLLATDVGGCREIVTERTGALVSKHATGVEIAHRISIFRDSMSNTREFRQGVKAFWDDRFNNQRNYKIFLELLNNTG